MKFLCFSQTCLVGCFLYIFFILQALLVMINHRALHILHLPISPGKLTRVMGTTELPSSGLWLFYFSLSQLVPVFMVFNWPIKPAASEQVFQNLQR